MAFLTNVWQWASVHWLAVSGVLAALITILNAATSIWQDHPKAVRWLSLIISALSVVRSKGAEPGVFGALKFPLIPEFKSKVVDKIITTSLVFILLASCRTVGGVQVFDPSTAVSTACGVEPAIYLLAQKGACDNLKEPSKSICVKVAALVHIGASVVLPVVGAIYDACKGETPRELPKNAEAPVPVPFPPALAPASAPNK